MASATSVERNASSPPLPKGFGVVIVGPQQASARGALVLHGAFALPSAEADELGHPAHRALVLLVQRDGGRKVATPFREHVLFPDDEVGTSGGVGGYFHLDIFDLQGGPAPGFYHLLVSIGEHVSPVLEIAVSP